MSEPWTVRANFWRDASALRAISGKLTVGDGWISFMPHGFDRATGGDARYAVRLVDVAALTWADRTGLMPRKRIVIHTRDGYVGHFLVPKQKATFARIQAEIDAVRP